MKNGKSYPVRAQDCIICRTCESQCPEGAIQIIEVETEPVKVESPKADTPKKKTKKPAKKKASPKPSKSKKKKF